MIISNDKKEIIIKSLRNEFSKYPIITKNIIEDLIEHIENDKKEFKGIKISTKNYENLNDIVVISMDAKIIIYQYICSRIEEDIDSYIELTTYIENLIKKYELRKNIEILKDIDTDEIINNYHGDRLFNNYVIRYVQAFMKGESYQEVTIPNEIQYETEHVIEPKNIKKQNKKEKKKRKQERRLQKQQATLDVLNIQNKIEKIINEPIIDIVNEHIEIIEKESSEQISETPKCKTVLQKGSAEPSYLTKLYRSINVIETSDDQKYDNYIALRYGYYNDSYYTIKEIMMILGLTLEQAKVYEVKSIIYIKNHVNQIVNDFELTLK